MKIAICYLSQHHGNTRKLVQAMVQGYDADLIDITASSHADLTGYEVIGFASGIYGFEFHPQVVEFLKENLPQGKKVFFVYTCGGAKGTGTKGIAKAAAERQAELLGEFGCRGFVTFGPFKLIGGAGKGRPNEADLARGREFIQAILAKAR